MIKRAYEVRVEEPAKSSLQTLITQDPPSAAGILRALEVLKTDPKVQVTGVKFTRSMAVATLRKEGYRVRTLKGWDFSDHRVFYFVDKVREKVIVKEVIERGIDTYEQNAPHIERLRENYARYHLFRWRAR